MAKTNEAYFGVNILTESKRGGKARAIRTKIVLLFDEDSSKQEILSVFIHKFLAINY
jgi:hypothetical protein